MLENNHTFATNPSLIAKAFKSEAIAILLTIFLGPIGLLYGSFLGAVIMTVLLIIAFILTVFNQHLQLMMYVLWLICPFWAIFSINRYHNKLLQPKSSQVDSSIDHNN